MERVAARELKQHTGEIIERVQRGERLLLTHRGNPVAIISPIDRRSLDEVFEREAADAESLGWLRASESAFSFWDNPEDKVWDRVRSRLVR